MYLKEVTDEHGLKQDKWSLQRLRFGDEGQLEVIGWGTRDKSGSKNYVVVCHKCSQDAELFGDGVFRATKGNILKRKSMPCGCAKNPRWTKEQHAIRCRRRAEELGYRFIDFIGPWLDSKTKTRLYCEKHGEWNTTIVSSLVNGGVTCMGCSIERAVKGNMKRMREISESYIGRRFGADNHLIGTDLFWNKSRNMVVMMCERCSGTFNRDFTDLSVKSTCPFYESPYRNQKEGYILILHDSGIPVGVKFGISKDTARRVREQSKRCCYEIELHSVYVFPVFEACRKAEEECKQTLECGVLPFSSIADGHTETTYLYNLDKIKCIYEAWGGYQI